MPFFLGSWVPIKHKVAWAEAYLHTKWHLDASSRLATIEMGRKLGGGLHPVPFFSGGSGVPIKHKVAWAEAYLHTQWHLSPFSRLATTDIGRKLGAVPHLGEADWVPI